MFKINRHVWAVYHYSEGIHDPWIFELRISNDLHKNFPNHVNIWLSLHDMRYMNFSWLLSSAKAGNLEQIFVKSFWRSWILIWQLITKCSSFSISRQYIQSLWSGSIFGRVCRPRSIARSCELARIFDIGMRYLGKVMQSKYMWH